MNFVCYGKRKEKVIVFLHGWGGSINSFLAVAKRLACTGFHVLVLDFPGHGKSCEPNKAYCVEDYAKDVISLLVKEGYNNVFFVAHSFGVRVAVKVAGGLKGLQINILGLVLIGGAGLKPRRTLKYKIKVWKYKRLKNLVREGKGDESCLRRFGSEDYKKLSAVMKASFVKIVNEDLSCDARLIKVPTLLIWGRKDKDTPLYMGKRYARLIANSRLLVYNTGHYCYIDEKDRFFEDLYNFLLLH